MLLSALSHYLVILARTLWFLLLRARHAVGRLMKHAFGRVKHHDSLLAVCGRVLRTSLQATLHSAALLGAQVTHMAVLGAFRAVLCIAAALATQRCTH